MLLPAPVALCMLHKRGSIASSTCACIHIHTHTHTQTHTHTATKGGRTDLIALADSSNGWLGQGRSLVSCFAHAAIKLRGIDPEPHWGDMILSFFAYDLGLALLRGARLAGHHGRLCSRFKGLKWLEMCFPVQRYKQHS